MTSFIPLIIGAYLLGSVPTAYLVARWRRGIDIRRYGSGNVGAANVLAVVSRRWSIPVTLFDIGKGAFAIWIAKLAGLGVSEQMVVGIAAIIGHNWTVFLKFRGGRGVFTSLGVIAMIAPKMSIIMLVVPFLLAPKKQVAFGVTLALVSLPLLSWFLAEPLGIKERLPVTLGFSAIAFIALLRRLLEPRTRLSRSLPKRQLFINRLLFDRDIRDREAWIKQNRAGVSS